jgi:Nucleotidyltransferase domain
MHQLPLDIEALVARFDAPNVLAIALMGSYAWGNAGPFSDIDLVRFTVDDNKVPLSGATYQIYGFLVVIGDVQPAQVERWFSCPEEAVNVIRGLQQAQILRDSHDYLAALKERASRFAWDAAMQVRANAYASRQMVGWIEEVHKGLEGVRREDAGRLLNALFGLTWGLSRLVQVQRGILISGDNAFFHEVEQAVGVDSEWAALRRAAFGVGTSRPSSLRGQVIAGLRLYVLTSQMLMDAWAEEDRLLITTTANRIMTELGGSYM